MEKRIEGRDVSRPGGMGSSDAVSRNTAAPSPTAAGGWRRKSAPAGTAGAKEAAKSQSERGGQARLPGLRVGDHAAHQGDKHAQHAAQHQAQRQNQGLLGLDGLARLEGALVDG